MEYNEERIAVEMLENGSTFQEVANELGYSKQYIHMMFGEMFKGRRVTMERYCIYPNIFSYMKKNRLTRAEFAKKIGVSTAQMYGVLKGERKTTKHFIDRILEITGMTYEEAFMEKEK